jgi:hypothetical protein
MTKKTDTSTYIPTQSRTLKNIINNQTKARRSLQVAPFDVSMLNKTAVDINNDRFFDETENTRYWNPPPKTKRGFEIVQKPKSHIR